MLVQRRAAYAERAGDLRHRQLALRAHRLGGGKLLRRDQLRAPAKPAAGAGGFASGRRALADQLALELRQGGEQVQLQPPGGRVGVDRLGQRPERDLAFLQLADELDEVPEASAEPIQPPDDERVASAEVVEAGVELGRRRIDPEPTSL